MTIPTTGALEQLEELVRALKENSDSQIKEALAKIAQDPQPKGQSIDIQGRIMSLMPQELKAVVDGAQKAGGAVEDTLGRATKPFGVWEAEMPEIAMTLGAGVTYLWTAYVADGIAKGLIRRPTASSAGPTP